MKIPFSPMTRRGAIISVAAAAAAAAANLGQARPATLITLQRSGAKEFLLRIALTNDHIFGLWSTGLAKGSSRLACYNLRGEQKWSREFGAAPQFAIVASGDNEVTAVAIDREESKLTFGKYDVLGPINQTDSLPLNGAVIAVAASSNDICALDIETNLFSKRFGVPEAPTRRPPAFDTPTIGGVKPRGIVASMHFLGTELVLLDHVKARTLTILSNGEVRSGRVIHPSIDAAIQKQDSDVAGRVALLRPGGNEHAVTFPTSISFAASDRASGIWLVSSLETGSVPVFRINSVLNVTATYNIQVPPDPLVRGRPPLMLAASPASIAFGFREGLLAIVDVKDANI